MNPNLNRALDPPIMLWCPMTVLFAAHRLIPQAIVAAAFLGIGIGRFVERRQ